MAQAFATAQQMADRTSGAIPVDHPYLEQALNAASTRIRNYCGWHIFPEVAETEVRVRAIRGQYLWLPTTHLVSVDGMLNAGVAIDEDALPLVDFSEDGRVDYVLWAAPTLIDFTHGYETAPDDLVDLCLELATGNIASRMGIAREQTLTSSITWARTSGRLTTDDKDALAEYKIGWMP